MLGSAGAKFPWRILAIRDLCPSAGVRSAVHHARFHVSVPDKLPISESRFSRVRVVPLGVATTMLFVSGTTARDEAPYDTAKQTEIVFARIAELLALHGGALNDIVKITVFLTDMREYDQYNAVRNRIFAETSVPPASSAVEAKLGKPAVRVEIEAIAVLKSEA
jgi:enamine deaminase RidA (YjgF/YER057c/UK114 family)